MVGTYGSEMLLHAVMFKAVEPACGSVQREISSADSMRPRQTYMTTRRGHPVTFVAFRQSPWHHYGVLGLEQTQVAVRSPYLDNDFVKTVYKAPGPAADQRRRPGCGLIREGNPVLAKLRTDRGIGGLNSVFTRAVLEFLFKAEYAYDYGHAAVGCPSGPRVWASSPGAYLARPSQGVSLPSVVSRPTCELRP